MLKKVYNIHKNETMCSYMKMSQINPIRKTKTICIIQKYVE